QGRRISPAGRECWCAPSRRRPAGRQAGVGGPESTGAPSGGHEYCDTVGITSTMAGPPQTWPPDVTYWPAMTAADSVQLISAHPLALALAVLGALAIGVGGTIL